MNFTKIAKGILKDLRAISESGPNERLPKEEQIRCHIYSELIFEYPVVAVEKGYGSIDHALKKECDLWCRDEDGIETWIEIKRCWYGRGFNVKTRYQVADWKKDIEKLASCPKSSNRVFVLVALSEIDPNKHQEQPPHMLSEICSFYPDRLWGGEGGSLSWRESSLGYAKVYFWLWPKGVCLPPTKKLLQRTM